MTATSLVLSNHAAVHADGLGFFSGATGKPPQSGCGPGGGVPDTLGGRSLIYSAFPSFLS